MVRTASLFSQLLEQIPRNDFPRLVAKHQAEYAAKGFTPPVRFNRTRLPLPRSSAPRFTTQPPASSTRPAPH